ncbi:MAG: ABC transporter ATP-binding protein [Candidatus Shapirobacteria bacterium]
MLKIYRRYYQFLFRYRGKFILFLISSLVFGLATAVQPYFYKLFIDAIPAGNHQHLLQILWFYLAFRLLEVVFDLLTFWLGDLILLPASADLRQAVMKKIQELDFAFHLSRSTGSLISLIKRGDGAFFDLFHSLHHRLFRISIIFFTMLFFLNQINHWIMGIMLISFALNLLLAWFLIRKNITFRRQFNQAEDKVSEVIVDNLINFETVKLFAKENWEQERLRICFDSWLKKLWRYANSFRFIDGGVGVLGNLGLLAILFTGLKWLNQNHLTTGEYVMILGFTASFYPRFFEMIYELRNLAKNHTDIQRYLGILNEETQVKDPPQPVNLSRINGEIEFKDISFSYPEGKKDALKKFSLRLRAGQSVALVGRSGAGKTTIVKLLMRFYDPDQGQITLDKTDIKSFAKSQLRSFIGVVPQEPILFNHTIAYNIGYGADKATEQEIIAAAKMANLHDFIETLPKKYATHVGERGVKLSGGQKQRLAIARMILSNPDIVIFDEATSQLDSESEKLIQEAFWKAVKNKTTIIIAHRLSTVVKAEKIVVMKDGEFAEMGSHRSLLAQKNSLYAGFWRLQKIN